MSMQRQSNLYEEIPLFSKNIKTRKACNDMPSELLSNSDINHNQDFYVNQNFSYLSMNSNIMQHERNHNKKSIFSDLNDQKLKPIAHNNKLSDLSISKSSIQNLIDKINEMEKQNSQIENQYKLKILKLKEQLLLKQKGTLQLTKQLANLQRQHMSQRDQIKQIAHFLKAQQEQKQKIKKMEKTQKRQIKVDLKSNSPGSHGYRQKFVSETQRNTDFDKKANLSPRAPQYNLKLRKSHQGKLLCNTGLGSMSPSAKQRNLIVSPRNNDRQHEVSPYDNQVASPKKKSIKLPSNSPAGKKLNLSPRAAIRLSTGAKESANIISSKKIQFPSQKNLGLRQKIVLFK